MVHYFRGYRWFRWWIGGMWVKHPLGEWHHVPEAMEQFVIDSRVPPLAVECWGK